MRDTASLVEMWHLLKEFEIVKIYRNCVIIQYYVVMSSGYVTSPWRSLRSPISWICDTTLSKTVHQTLCNIFRTGKFR
jgi:hypothetical protein